MEGFFINRWGKRIQQGGLLVLVAVTMATALPVEGVAADQAAPKLAAKAGVAVDATTGQILYDHHSRQALPVASMSKLLSVYVVLTAIKSGQLTWQQRIKVDANVAKIAKNRDYTNVPLRAGHRYTVKSLYQAALIYSANGAIEALGNAVSGSPHRFVDRMKQTAQQLGMTNAKIYNASGLLNSQVGTAGYANVAKKAENTWSARDQAKLSVALLKQYPEVLKTTRIKTLWFAKGTADATKMTNWNWMLPGSRAAYKLLPVDGLKTGTSTAAGANFTGTGTHAGHRIITVVMHAAHKSQDDPARFEQTQKIMSYVYNHYTPVTLKAGTRFQGRRTVTTHDATALTAPVATGRSVQLWLPKGQTQQVTVTSKLASRLVVKGGLEAPVARGTTVGQFQVKGMTDQAGFLTGATTPVPMVVTEPVAKANIFVQLWRNLLALF